MSIPVETIQTDSFSMRYFRFGSGSKTFVILPGLSIQSVMGSADAVAESYASFAEEYTVFLFDRREDLPERYSVYDMGRDTAAAMKELGLRDVYLFGASQGGMLALVIAIEYPELVHKLVLGSSSAHVGPQQYAVLQKWIRMAEEKDREGLYLEFGKELYPPELFEQSRDLLLSMAQSVTDEDLRRFIILAKGTEGFDVVSDLEKISCPVMAIGVFEDAVLDSDATMEIAEKLDERGNFKLYMYIGYGHAAFDTAPDYKDRMLSFFQA